MSVWSEVSIGIVMIMGTVWLVKTAINWNIYRKSIQTEIYSNYFEYARRAKSLKKLSESYYFKSRFGKHRIYYQVAQTKDEKYPKAYVVIILSSGLYILRVMNQYPAKNPALECRYFAKQIENKFVFIAPRVNKMLVVPQKDAKAWKGTEEKEILVVSRKEMFAFVQKDYEKNKGVLSERQIDKLYEVLATSSIELENE